MRCDSPLRFRKWPLNWQHHHVNTFFVHPERPFNSLDGASEGMMDVSGLAGTCCPRAGGARCRAADDGGSADRVAEAGTEGRLNMNRTDPGLVACSHRMR